jgi:hypothetical protein
MLDMLIAQESPEGTESADDLAWNLTFAILVLPPVISIINQKHWRQEYKALTAVAVCIIYSMIITVFRPGADLKDWRNTIAETLIGTCAIYKIFWNPSTLGPKLEAATSFKTRASGLDNDPNNTATLDDQPLVQRLKS